jgi:drug/metabolite transporter (DMT)-like permease
MNFRIIGKGFFLLVIIGFFMPMACDMNAFELVDNDMLLPIGVFAVFATFISAIVGLLIGVLLLVKKRVHIFSDWIITLACSLSYVIMFCYAGFYQDNYDSFQSGAFMALIGSVAPLVTQIISAIKKET